MNENENVFKDQLCLTGLNLSSTKVIDKTSSCIIKERLENYGINSLLNEEIIYLLTGIKIEIIRTAITNFGLNELIKYLNTMKISKAHRRKLELLNLYHKRILSSRYKDKPVLNSSSKAGEFAMTLFTDKTYEAFYIVCLDSQNRVNQAVLAHEGTINEAPVYPRIIVELSLKFISNSVILCHNHPGGSLQPSTADIEVTKRIRTALEAISIKVVDHIIVAGDKYTSFAEKGLLPE